LSFHVFPEDWENDNPDGPISSTLRLALDAERNRQKTALGIKRLVDIAGSLAVITLFLPLFLIVALAVKLTSKGPVLFRQVRLGRYGRKFTFLKFRSMYVNNDHSIHEQYVKRFIAGPAESECSTATRQNVYKLTADPRVTPVGRFLRKTSLDELPQFFNVLRGDMSLVGPRPPVPYEFKCYDVWHRTRVFEVKPGITGLWQVTGRSKTSFDDLVRLDLAYAKTWSISLDIKILLQSHTPCSAATALSSPIHNSPAWLRSAIA
jgi:lipopolysaccharide/colanic/teichoic acid biosynthesis glycosyltransferase